MTLPWYATREEIKAELDVKETARSNNRIDRALDDASRAVDGLCHRRFYPEQATRYFDWPNEQNAAAWRLWLDDNELVSVTTMSSGGTTIAAADYFLEPNRWGPPYNRLEIDLASSAAFGGGDTHQRDITIVGLFGYRNDETASGTIAEALDASETAVDVDGAASALLGVGSVLRVDTERMIVTGRTQLTTSQTLQTPLTAATNDTTVAVTTGTAYAVDEVLLLDSERMLIVDIAGNNLTVKRAWDGSVLAAHTGSTIYAPRTLTVTRGALGTTAATHSSAAAAYRWDPPGPVKQLTIAEAVNSLLQGQAGYARTVKTAGGRSVASETSGLSDLRDRVYTSHGRKGRVRAI